MAQRFFCFPLIGMIYMSTSFFARSSSAFIVSPRRTNLPSVRTMASPSSSYHDNMNCHKNHNLVDDANDIMNILSTMAEVIPTTKKFCTTPIKSSSSTTTTTTSSSSSSTSVIFSMLSSLILCSTIHMLSPIPAMAVVGSSSNNDAGASIASNSKITTGGASTLQSGRTIAITRGVNLDNSNFAGTNLKGVAFQQSIVRDADFTNSNLVGASFFDATLDGSDFDGADMSLCNIEMAQFNRANLKNAVLREMYVSGSTLFEGVKSIENSDWSDTQLRKDQTKYLCNHPTAKGKNPVTGVDTRESLMCPD